MSHVLTPYKSNQLRGHPERATFNRLLSQSRSEIERRIGALKMKFKVMRERWHHPDKTLHSWALLACGLVSNFVRRIKHEEQQQQSQSTE